MKSSSSDVCRVQFHLPAAGSGAAYKFFYLLTYLFSTNTVGRETWYTHVPQWLSGSVFILHCIGRVFASPATIMFFQGRLLVLFFSLVVPAIC